MSNMIGFLMHDIIFKTNFIKYCAYGIIVYEGTMKVLDCIQDSLIHNSKNKQKRKKKCHQNL